MFKRNPRTYARVALEFFYPRGGWYRAALYIVHRIRRLPDPSHRIARGIAVGVFICYTPLFGLHIILAAAIAWVIRGNILAAVFATFWGNPVTFPLIAELSMGLGSKMLGQPHALHLPQIVEAFWTAFREIGSNTMALFTDENANWADLHHFFRRVFLPYMVGGLPWGIASAVLAYFGSQPLINAYQKRRIKKMRARYEKRMKARAARADDGKEPR